jgi:MipA family protein
MASIIRSGLAAFSVPVAIIASCTCPSQVQATEYTVGVGAGVAPEFEGSQHYELEPRWSVKAVDLWGEPTYAWLMHHDPSFEEAADTNFRSNLLDDENWRLGISGQYVAKRNDVSNNAVDRLHSADSSTMLGVLTGYDFPLTDDRTLGLEVNTRYDFVKSNGYPITPGVSFVTPLANWTLSTRLDGTYASGDYMSNYFGISQASANRSGLHQFDANPGFKDASLSAAAIWRFALNWDLTAFALPLAATVLETFCTARLAVPLAPGAASSDADSKNPIVPPQRRL